MSVERLDLEIPPARIPHHLQVLLDQTADDLSDWQGTRDRNEFVPADYVLVLDALCALRPLMPSRRPVFLEWGSGLGVVTLMAAALGWQATGIEIQTPLVRKSLQFARSFDLPATFLNGSFFPSDATRVKKLSERCGEADLVYVYPWPDQELEIFDLFDRLTRKKSILLAYYGTEDVRVFQKQS